MPRATAAHRLLIGFVALICTTMWIDRGWAFHSPSRSSPRRARPRGTLALAANQLATHPHHARRSMAARGTDRRGVHHEHRHPPAINPSATMAKPTWPLPPNCGAPHTSSPDHFPNAASLAPARLLPLQALVFHIGGASAQAAIEPGIGLVLAIAALLASSRWARAGLAEKDPGRPHADVRAGPASHHQHRPRVRLSRPGPLARGARRRAQPAPAPPTRRAHGSALASAGRPRGNDAPHHGPRHRVCVRRTRTIAAPCAPRSNRPLGPHHRRRRRSPPGPHLQRHTHPLLPLPRQGTPPHGVRPLPPRVSRHAQSAAALWRDLRTRYRSPLLPRCGWAVDRAHSSPL